MIVHELCVKILGELVVAFHPHSPNIIDLFKQLSNLEYFS